MEVFARSTAMKRRASGDDASCDDDETVCEGNTEGEERCGDFSSCVDRKDAEHEAEEHRAAIAHKCAGALRQAQGKGKIEEETCSTDSYEKECEESNIRLSNTCAYGEESDDGETHCRDGADLPRYSVEPVDGIHS